MTGERGSAAVETVLAMTVLVPLLFSIVGFGDLLQRWLGQDAAAAQAARLAGEVGGDAPEVRQLLAEELLAAGIDASQSDVLIAPSRVGWREPVTVQVATRHSLPIPFVASFGVVLRSTFVSRGEVNR